MTFVGYRGAESHLPRAGVPFEVSIIAPFDVPDDPEIRGLIDDWSGARGPMFGVLTTGAVSPTRAVS